MVNIQGTDIRYILESEHMSNVAGRQCFHVHQENRYVFDKFRHDLVRIFVVQQPHTGATQTLLTAIKPDRDQVCRSQLAPLHKQSEGSQWGLRISIVFRVNVVWKLECDRSIRRLVFSTKQTMQWRNSQARCKYISKISMLSTLSRYRRAVFSPTPLKHRAAVTDICHQQ